MPVVYATEYMMNGSMHEEHHEHHAHHEHNKAGLNKMAASVTLHCLTGCAIGEISGMMLGAVLGLSTLVTVLISIILSFFFGFSLSILPIRRAGVALFAALSLVVASDTLSITTMEIVDNAVMVLIPGAMNAGLTDIIFWVSMALSLAAAFIAAYPVNRYLLTKGKGHALVMKYHGHDH